jgi:hypothetical protein
MNKWKLISGIALVFILGALVGSIATGFYFKHRYPRLGDHRAGKAFIMERLSKELNLTQDQKINIGKIIEQMEEKRREYFLRNWTEIEKSIDQMKKELNNDQQKKLDALRENFEKRQKGREERQFHR